jgi:hypothetical protein
MSLLIFSDNMTLSLVREMQAVGLAGNNSEFHSAVGAIASLAGAINSGRTI